MTPEIEAARYEYDLDQDSLVIDIGGYQGAFAQGIYDKYKCVVVIYEPVKRFFDAIKEKFKNVPRVVVLPCGVSGHSGTATMAIRGDSTGQFATNGVDWEQVAMVDIITVLSAFPSVDLVKLNCEGGEFSILESVLRNGLATHVRNWQVQFHEVVPEYRARYEAIRAGLLKTHRISFEYPFRWENYELLQPENRMI